MAPMKRPAAPAAGRASAATKKPKLANKLSAVAKVVKSATAYPAPVVAMLSQHLELSLGLAKEERHEFQERIVQMVAEVLHSVQAGLQASIQEAETKVAEADGEKARRAAAVEAAAADVTAKAASVAAAETAAAAAAASQQAAEKALKVATSEQKEGDASLKVAEAKKEKIESAIASFFAPLKEGTAESPKDGLKAIIQLGKEFHFDPSLQTSLPSALGKAPAERGSFDTLVINQVEEQLTKRVAELTAELEAGHPARAERAAKVEAATAEVTVLTEASEAAQAAAKAAHAALKEAEATQKTANKELKSFGPEMKEVQSHLSDTKASLEELETGALAEFKELAERSNAPPAEEAAPPAEQATLPDLDAAATQA